MNYGFIIDNRKCIGCHACTVACKSEHDVPIGVNRTWVKYIEKGEFPHAQRLFSVMRCNHCEDAPCIEICPVTALFMRDDGIVDFDQRRCIGCKGCMQACPYDALYIDPNTDTAAKCNYCAHRIDIGLEPACVNVCPVHAIISGDMHDPLSEISQLLAREQVTVRKVEKGTRPKLFYIDADEASLTPISTEQSNDYMWSSQAGGVGHFAKETEAGASEADPQKMLPPAAAGNDSDDTWIGGDDPAGRVLVPAGSNDLTMLEKAKQVVKEKARRVYDTPDKGVLWGWEVSAYIWTKAVSAGAFLVPFLAMVLDIAHVSETLQWFGIGVGLLFLMLTGILLVMDLDKPSRFIYVLLRPQWNSWLVRGGYAIAIYGGLLTLLGVARFFDWSGVALMAAWGGALFAIITAVYTAFLFAQASGRDFWQSPTLSLHMILHAFMAGAATFSLLGAFVLSDQAWSAFLARVLGLGLSFNLLVIATELATAHPTADAKRTVQMIVSGQFSKLFWGGAIVLGNVLPLLLILFGGAQLLAIAGVLVLAGIYIIEHIWVRAPQLISLS